MAEFFGYWMWIAFWVFGGAVTTLCIVGLCHLALHLVYRAIGLTLNMIAIGEAARELKRQGRSPWLDRSARWTRWSKD